ncbi:MAG: hypothetical protein ACREPR_15315 [Brasilonema sp.]
MFHKFIADFTGEQAIASYIFMRYISQRKGCIKPKKINESQKKILTFYESFE